MPSIIGALGLKLLLSMTMNGVAYDLLAEDYDQPAVPAVASAAVDSSDEKAKEPAPPATAPKLTVTTHAVPPPPQGPYGASSYQPEKSANPYGAASASGASASTARPPRVVSIIDAPQAAKSRELAARIEHLRLAAVHLEAAGMTAEVQRIRARLDQETQSLVQRLQIAEVELAKLRQEKVAAPLVLLKVKLFEVNKTKIQKIGFDFQSTNKKFVTTITSLITVGGEPSPVITLNTADAKSATNVFQALTKIGCAKVLAEPSLITGSGRPCHFHSGGELPIPLLQQNAIEYKKLGTCFDAEPVILRDGKLHLHVRVGTGEIDATRKVTVGGYDVPAIKRREIDASAELQSGQVLVLTGVARNVADGQAMAPNKGTADNKAAGDKSEELILVALVESVVLANPAEELSQINAWPAPATR